MKRTIAVTLLTLALSVVAVGFASANDCTCSNGVPTTTTSEYDPFNWDVKK